MERYKSLVAVESDVHAKADKIFVGGDIDRARFSKEQENQTKLCRHFLSFSSSKFNDWAEREVLPNGRVVSIFLPLLNGLVNSSVLSVHEVADEGKLEGAAKGGIVIVTFEPLMLRVGKDQESTDLPLLALEPGAWTERAQLDEYRGIGGSKLGGVPCWLQDDLDLERYDFLFQIDETHLVKFAPQYFDLFQGGMAYFFVKKHLPEMRVSRDLPQLGLFFTQFS